MLGVAGAVLSLLQVAVGGGPVYCQPGQVRQPLIVVCMAALLGRHDFSGKVAVICMASCRIISVWAVPLIHGVASPFCLVRARRRCVHARSARSSARASHRSSRAHYSAIPSQVSAACARPT